MNNSRNNRIYTVIMNRVSTRTKPKPDYFEIKEWSNLEIERNLSKVELNKIEKVPNSGQYIIYIEAETIYDAFDKAYTTREINFCGG